jgi:hypothetical protein
MRSADSTSVRAARHEISWHLTIARESDPARKTVIAAMRQVGTSSSPAAARALESGTSLALRPDVTIRIMNMVDGPGRTVRIDGWLAAADVAVLEEAVGAGARGTRLELADLRSADTAGVAALRGLEARGALLYGAAPFLRLLLGERTGGDRTSGAGNEEHATPRGRRRNRPRRLKYPQGGTSR